MWEFELDYPRQLKEVCEYSRLVYERGLVSAEGGNISARCGENFLITGTNVALRSADREGVVFCGPDGSPLAGREGLRPSKETPFHKSVYRYRPEVNFIIHAHPSSSVAFTLLNKELPMLTDSSQMKLVRVPTIPEAWPGTPELAANVEKAVRENPDTFAFLMKAHGVLVLGREAEECFCLLELLEDTSKIALWVEAARRN